MAITSGNKTTIPSPGHLNLSNMWPNIVLDLQFIDNIDTHYLKEYLWIERSKSKFILFFKIGRSELILRKDLYERFTNHKVQSLEHSCLHIYTGINFLSQSLSFSFLLSQRWRILKGSKKSHMIAKYVRMGDTESLNMCG